MKNLTFKSSLSLVFFFASTQVWSEAQRVDGKKILAEIHQGTKVKSIPLAQLPQNFGGQGKKLGSSDGAELSQEALNLALADEALFQKVISEVLFPFQQMILDKKVNFEGLAKKNATFQTLEKSSYEGKGDYFESQWKKNKESVNMKNAHKWWANYLGNFKKIQFVKISPYSLNTQIAERDPLTSLPQVFEIEARMDIRGEDKNKSRQHDRGTLSFRVEKKTNEKNWSISNVSFIQGESLKNQEASFQEVASFQDGELSNYLRKEAIRRGGYALALGDIDGDDQVDMVVGHMGAVEVFKGLPDGSFKKLSNEKLGIENETLVKSAVISDFDNDGKKDLLLVRFAPNEEAGKDIVVYKNLGEKFQRHGHIKNRFPSYYAMPSAVADYNKDGLLDFYIGFPGAKDFTVLDKNESGYEGKKEFHPQGLFYNLSELQFKEVTKEKLPLVHNKKFPNGYPEAAVVFAHTSTGIDYDLDGDMDIVVVDDKANLSPLYKNDGTGSFTQVADKIGLTNYDFGMGFTAADLDNDGKLEFIYTNVNFLPAERLYHSLRNNFSDYSKLPGTFGVRVFKSNNSKDYSDITALTQISGCGEGIGGVEVIDYNNDGNMDIYVANGLWSGNSEKHDLSSLFVRANAINNFDYQEVLNSSVGIEEANTSFMRILTDFQGDVENMKELKGIHPSMAGFQRNCLFRNNGNGTFTEVGFLEGVDSIADGYIVGTADFNKDGKMDLVLRNGDPGTDKNRHPAVQVFLNKKENKQKSVIIALNGTNSNRDGVGAILDATIGGKKYLRHIVANNGAMQSEGVIHFGLGQNDKIETLNIRWPSGKVDVLKNIPAGRHRILETGVIHKITEN